MIFFIMEDDVIFPDPELVEFSRLIKRLGNRIELVVYRILIKIKKHLIQDYYLEGGILILIMELLLTSLKGLCKKLINQYFENFNKK